ncbi:sensor histidine kinase [Tepidamorphus sp. 3E244]|uniref:sensor histidine kinase n=1 Tax=Tepidamorphus sp. 3E244 TaxID=3385498 RepID=UPI0038FC3385
MIISDLEGAVHLIVNLPDCWDMPDADTATMAAIFGEATAARIGDVVDSASQSQSVRQRQFDVVRGDRNFELTIIADTDAEMLRVIIKDVTESRRRERLLRSLLMEVSHRSKNLLAIIQSIASQTARRSTDIETFLNKFRGRLFSMARSQDLVTDTNWSGVDFNSLARSQLRLYTNDGEANIEIDGENVQLSPNESLHIGLALHELIVNSATYGALAGVSPSISLSCNRYTESGTPMIEIIWHEDISGATDEAGEQPAIERRFGSSVLEAAVPTAVGGNATFSISDSQVNYQLRFPENAEAA